MKINIATTLLLLASFIFLGCKEEKAEDMIEENQLPMLQHILIGIFLLPKVLQQQIQKNGLHFWHRK